MLPHNASISQKKACSFVLYTQLVVNGHLPRKANGNVKLMMRACLHVRCSHMHHDTYYKAV